MTFLNDNAFLLTNDFARTLYHQHAAPMPIYDYHCHLPPEDLASNRSFDNLYDLWLAGDHYKWRAMRYDGVPESHCTGDASPYDKFLAFATTVPHTVGNPLFHWTHLELKRYFGITTLLNADTAKGIWDAANEQLATLRVSDILEKFNVALIGTTDDPADSLEHHAKLREQPIGDTTVVPAFRPDKFMPLGGHQEFIRAIERLSAASNTAVHTLDDFDAALHARHDVFHEMGSRLSDHGITCLRFWQASREKLEADFADCLSNSNDHTFHSSAVSRLAHHVLASVFKLNHKRVWAQQLHLGASRNVNEWAYRELGPDTGFDTISDAPLGDHLELYLGHLAGEGTLAKTILYNLNPRDNALFAAMCGNFPGPQPGWVQFGSAWWFNDQKSGMQAQLRALMNVGLVSRFVGMLTDSRSFMSYPRHEYFRRILCDMLGRDVEAGELPRDEAWLGGLVRDVCFRNAVSYFGMPVSDRYTAMADA